MTGRTALVLGGGGSLGAVEAGFIRRTMELGISFDLMVGTSVGAINAAHVAFHDTDNHDCLERIWLGLARRRLFSRNPFTIAAGVLRSRMSLYSDRLIRSLVAEHLASDRFEDARVPLFITATDICSGEREVFGSGSLTQAILASTAIPGLFPPVRIGGRMYVDGGVTSGGDIAVAVEQGASTVVFIDLRPKSRVECPRNIFEVISRSFELLAEDRAACAVEHRDYPARVIHIQPGLTGGRGDFKDAPRLLSDSYRMACEILDRCWVGGTFNPGHYHGDPAGNAE
jgi:NTE family protein